MKKVIWVLFVFVFWCVGSAIWYMFTVKGIRTDPAYFNPHVRVVAIVEILVMILGACLLGYAAGWTIGRLPVSRLNEELEYLKQANQHLTQNEVSDHQRMEGIQQRALAEAKSEKEHAEKLKQKIVQIENELRALSENNKKLAVSLAELDALRFHNKQLEFKNEELEKELQNQLNELRTQASRPIAPEPMHPFVRPIDDGDHDDLTRIKGIGPFIEKRLNMLGIYTFSQIASFTPEIEEHVAKAIEFFPQRMRKDNWKAQATQLESERN
jgi:predicted flap endonuclease-1-like 5' DNA nuclease